uniref:Alpha-catulin n=1 Tax=Ditylenchus dipsaci TaxID=166011 RepID=A0A915E636_9BILA
MQPNQSIFTFDPRNLEIKTKSVEHTLLPLVTQISTLVNFKENIITGNRPKSERALRAALKIGNAVEAAVERFVVVGETISDENPDIQPEMYDACQEARVAGASIANLHSSMIDDEVGPSQSTIGIDKSQLIKAARRLLSSVTRVLLLADRVLVKHILRAEDKIVYSLTKLENTMNFTEFVKIFTEFGGQMVDLAHRQAQMWVSRSCLERLTMLLLTASKTLLRHPEDLAARQCRDGVFQQIRLSLQLIGICVSDGVLPFESNCYCPDSNENIDGPIDIGIQLTANVCIKQLTEMLEMVKMMALIDFTDSPFTVHHHREQILDFLEECRFEMSNLVNPQQEMSEHMRSEIIEVTVERLNRRLKDLRKQLQAVAVDQIAAVFRTNDDQTILSSIKTCSVSGDIDGVEKYLEKFREHAAHLQEVCRLLHHVSLTDALHVYTGHSERNLRALAPLTLLAGRTLCIHPSSRIARENLEVFCDTWAANVNDLSRLAKDLDAAASNRTVAEKQAYMSLPRPGVSNRDSTCSSSTLSSINNSSSSASVVVVVNIAGLVCNGVKSGVDVVTNKLESLENCVELESNQLHADKASEEVLYSTVNKRVKPQPARTPTKSIEGTNCHSAFVKYTKYPIEDESISSNQFANEASAQSIAFNNKTNGRRVTMSQSYNDNIPSPSSIQDQEEDHYRKVDVKVRKAPLAVCDEEIDEDGDGRVVSSHGNHNHKFENRISLILEDLQLERHGSTQKPTKPITLDVEDQQKIAKVGLEMKLLTAEVEAEAEKWDEYAENDIVKRAKAMSAMSYNMYLFTKGDGPLKTTHDLFTQAEFFAEQANKMFKTVREFAFEVPGSAEKNDLQVILEKIPLYCQQLQVLVKSPTVGKSATFSKVDSVISETKSLMNEIAMLVTACFVCATKFEIEFRGTSMSRSVLIDGAEYPQRSSRESTMWRRTPSMRRTPQVQLQSAEN